MNGSCRIAGGNAAFLSAIAIELSPRHVMVAYDPTRPPDRSRELSDESVARLRTAIAAQWRTGQAESAETRDALLSIAREARERGIRPEALIVVLKRIESDVARSVPERSAVVQRQLTEWLVTTCVRAYFEDAAT